MIVDNDDFIGRLRLSQELIYKFFQVISPVVGGYYYGYGFWHIGLPYQVVSSGSNLWGALDW